MVLLGVASRSDGATLSALAVAVNDVPIAPTDYVVIEPGDTVTSEFYLSGWDDDVPGSRLKAYQVGIDGVASYHSGSNGHLEPVGWDVIWPSLCQGGNTCPEETPVCNFAYGTCGCLAGGTSCPVGHSTCERGLCRGSNHDRNLSTFIDVQRPDYAYNSMNPLTAMRSGDSDLRTLWGGVPLLGNGPLDPGGSVYLGTHEVRATDEACGVFRFVMLGADDCFLILSGATDFYVSPSFAPLTIVVDNGGPCPMPLISSSPSGYATLPRIENNVIDLTFAGDVSAPDAGEIEIIPLTPQVCAGGAGVNLAEHFEFEVDAVSDPTTLHVRQSVPGTLQHRTWYRIRNTGAWSAATPFQLDFLAMHGDANGDRFVNFADLGAIFHQLPKLPGEPFNPRYDINGDGLLNFADLGAAFAFVPALPAPHPCP